MEYYGWKPYVSVAERRRQAEKMLTKANKAGKAYAPIAAYRGAVAKTVWGQQWCDHLESLSDYANRLPRGRTYVRNGSVIDLQITAGLVKALVMGSSLYEIEVTFKPVGPAQWQSICKACSNSIASLVEILQGKLSTAVMQRLCEPGTGLMPTPKVMSFRCNCPDWAGMCKHVAAVLYGVGARLDEQPELLFTLRQVDAKELVQITGSAVAAPRNAPMAAKVLDEAMLDDVFGLDMGAQSQPSAPAQTAGKPAKSGKGEAAAPSKKAIGARAKSVNVTVGKIAAKPAQEKAALAKKRVTAKAVVRRSAGDAS